MDGPHLREKLSFPRTLTELYVFFYYSQHAWVRSLGWEDLLEEEMATHSNILVWENFMNEEHGGLHTVSPQGHKESDMTEVT